VKKHAYLSDQGSSIGAGRSTLRHDIPAPYQGQDQLPARTTRHIEWKLRRDYSTTLFYEISTVYHREHQQQTTRPTTENNVDTTGKQTPRI
jgi:hypothetical protein